MFVYNVHAYLTYVYLYLFTWGPTYLPSLSHRNCHPFILHGLCFVHFRGLTLSITHRFRDTTELRVTIHLHSPKAQYLADLATHPPRRAREIINNINQGGFIVLF